MFNKAAEKTLGQLILVGTPFTTIFIVTNSVTDPVNATKLAAAGGLGLGLLSVALFFNFKKFIYENKTFLLMAGFFVVSGISSVLNSESPISQNIYGSYGRNTGLLAYLILLSICISALALRSSNSFMKLILGILIAGVVNVLYCGWVLIFGDFLSWTNPYGNILGLFGNPNFIAAFLGILITTLFALLANPGTSTLLRISGVFLALAAFYEVVASNAVQGLVVTAGGAAIVIFFVIRAKFKSILITASYFSVVISLGTLSILGALQKGPFDFIYKNSVSLRGAYWNAGITMGKDHPLTGVGMDAYGDWYRRARSEHAATVLPGPNTITNAAHNVVVDIFAYGGFPLLISYLGMLAFAAVSALKVIRRDTSYNPVFVAMFASWVCYQVQSLISINQIGLALWGWILTGAIIAYERMTRPESSVPQVNSRKPGKLVSKKSDSIMSPQLIAGLGIILGVLIAVPPFSSDSSWRAALDSKDANKVQTALRPAYLNPVNSSRYAQAVQLYANSNLLDDALATAIEGVKFNPDYFDAWKLLYFLPNSTSDQKRDAVKNMKRLDPLNPDILAH